MDLYKALFAIIGLQFVVLGVILHVLLNEIKELTSRRNFKTNADGSCFIKEKELRPKIVGLDQPGANEEGYLSELKKGSRVFCFGKSQRDRICKFQNLCYHSQWKKYLFFHGQWTILHRAQQRSELDEPALLDLSSVDDHNTQYFNYVDFPVEAVKDFRNIKFIKGSSIIFNRFNPENLMHVLHDDLLPLYTTLRLFSSPDDDADSLKSNTTLVLMDKREQGPWQKLYEIFTKQKIIFEKDLLSDDLTCFKDVIVGLSKETTWYQYGFKSPQGPIRNKTVEKKMLVYFIKHVKHYLNCDAKSKAKYVVLIVRKQTRLIRNQVELSISLANLFKKEIFLLDLEEFDLLNAICHINQAVALVGMHGAELILSLFLNHGSTLVELFPYGINPENYTPYKILADMLGLNYVAWRNNNLLNTKGYPHRPQWLGGLQHLKKEKQDDVMNASDIPQHLCCDNPYWLYKIYQDTIVDIPSLEKQITEMTNLNEIPAAVKLDDGHFTMINPDVVRNVSCVLKAEGNARSLRISWQEPVNSKFLAGDFVYQVLVQEGSDEALIIAYELTDTLLVLDKSNTRLPCRVWLRTKCGGKLGLLSDTTLCKENS
eukprot:gene18720-20609_t